MHMVNTFDLLKLAFLYWTFGVGCGVCFMLWLEQ